MDEVPPELDREKEYMMFLLKLINNYLLEQEVPDWFNVKKLSVTTEPPSEPDE